MASFRHRPDLTILNRIASAPETRALDINMDAKKCNFLMAARNVQCIVPTLTLVSDNGIYITRMGVPDPKSMSVRELLQTYCDLMGELRKREILRSSNNPVADYSELLFCGAFGWARQGGSNLGFDAVCSKGLRYEIKGRRLTSDNQSRQLSFIRKLPDKQFDFLAGILLHKGFAIKRGALVPHGSVLRRARFSKHANGWLFELKEEVWREPGVVDVTNELAMAAEKLG